MDVRQDSQHSPTGPTPKELTLLVWSTLGDLYGPLWTSGYGKTPTAAWRATLSGLTADEVKRGLRATAESGERHPPSAPQFRARCRPGTPEQRAFNARLEGDQRAALPAPEQMAAHTAMGRRWLAYWWLRGIRPRPREVTVEQIDEMLAGADVAAMDAAVGRHRAATLAEYGHTETSSNHGKAGD